MDTIQGQVVVENRSPDPTKAAFGYVYVDETRCGYDEDNGLWPTRPSGYWPEPTPFQYDRALEALAYQPWGHRIPIVKEWQDQHAQEQEEDG